MPPNKNDRVGAYAWCMRPTDLKTMGFNLELKSES